MKNAVATDENMNMLENGEGMGLTGEKKIGGFLGGHVGI